MMASFIQRIKPERVIFILGRASETISQFKEIFENYYQIRDYLIKSSKTDDISDNDMNKDYLAYLVSQQKLKRNRTNPNYLRKLNAVFPADKETLIFIDEAQFRKMVSKINTSGIIW